MKQNKGIQEYHKLFGNVFPIILGIIMPIIMTLTQDGSSFEMPDYLIDAIIYVIIAYLVGAVILPMGKISSGFAKIMHAEKPKLLRIVVSQIPGAIIFSFIMGLSAIILNKGLRLETFKFFLKGLPKAILIAMVVQVIVELIFEIFIKPSYVDKKY